MIETRRLVLRELGPDDLEGLLPVYLSNGDFLATHEGSGGEAGGYDLSMLERDWYLGTMQEGHHQLGIYLREGGEPVGWIDYLEQSPTDGMPWLGGVMVDARHQRRGIGDEAVRGLLAHVAREHGWTRIRAAVDEDDTRAQGFARHLGFLPVARRERHGPQGTTVMDVLELQLAGSLQQ